MSTPRIDVEAPIRPNEGLGGISIGVALKDIQGLVTGLHLNDTRGRYVANSPFEIRYYLSEGRISFSVDVRNGKVFKVSAYDGYRGLLFGCVFVGMRVRKAMSLVAGMFYDEAEEMLFCKGHPGVSLDVSAIDPPVEDVPDMDIAAISVFTNEISTPSGQLGDW